jgi:large subunit ribosomal protein L1
MKRSKRYQSLTKKVDKNKEYELEEALNLVKETGIAKFDASVEVHINLGINPKKSDQQVRTAFTLPNGTGKTKKIAAFVPPEKEKEAREAESDIVGGEELINQIKTSGKIDFELAVAAPEMMPKMALIAKILGPRGLMPSPKNETITTNLKKTIGELKKGKVDFKNDDTGNIHQVIGKVSFSQSQLLENYNALINALKKAKPSAAKGTFIKSVSIASSMGPGIKIKL